MPVLLWLLLLWLPPSSAATADWLTATDDAHASATVTVDADGVIALSNGLVRRSFVTTPTFGTVDLAGASCGGRSSCGAMESALRHVHPEGAFELNGAPFLLGGLQDLGWNTSAIYNPRTKQWDVPVQNGQHTFLNRTGLRQRLRVAAGAWTYRSHRIATPEADLPFTPGRRNSPTYTTWPPAGVRLAVELAPPAGAAAELRGLNVTLVYELYDGAPLLSKWLEVSVAPGSPPVLLDAVTTEVLAVSCDFSPSSKAAGARPHQQAQLSRLEVTVTEHYGVTNEHTGGQWTTSGATSTSDPGACEPVLATSYNCCGDGGGGISEAEAAAGNHSLLPILPARGPAVQLGDPSMPPTSALNATPQPQRRFVSARTILLMHDSMDPTRQMLGRHQIYRRLAPWVQEHELQIHPAVTGYNTSEFNEMLEQCIEVGFEGIVLDQNLAAPSLYDLNSSDPRRAIVIANAKRANEQGISVGAYELTVLDRGRTGYGLKVPEQWDRVDPAKGTLNADACYASGWRDDLERRMFGLTGEANFSIVLTDGPFGGGACTSHNHSHHRGEADSVYQQFRLQAEFYRKMAAQGVFIRAADHYPFQGVSKGLLGFNERQFSLPREIDLLVSRQSLLDDIWRTPAVMGWYWIPMVPFHAGGAAAAFQPYDHNLQDWSFALSQYLGAGCGMTWRGTRLYDSKGDASYSLIREKVAWFKAHRAILTSDIVHVLQPTGQGVDAFLHVNPRLESEKALAMVFNPTALNQTKAVVVLPLYYSGLADSVMVSVDGGVAVRRTLARDYSLAVELSVRARSTCWVLVTGPHRDEAGQQEL